MRGRYADVRMSVYGAILQLQVSFHAVVSLISTRGAEAMRKAAVIRRGSLAVGVILAVLAIAACGPDTNESGDPVLPQELYPANPVAGILVTEEPPTPGPTIETEAPIGELASTTVTAEKPGSATPEEGAAGSPPEPEPTDEPSFVTWQSGYDQYIGLIFISGCVGLYAKPSLYSTERDCLSSTHLGPLPLEDLGETAFNPVPEQDFTEVWRKIRTPEEIIGWILVDRELILPLPTVEFPDNVALLAHHHVVRGTDAPLGFDIERIYWRGGELVREAVFDTSAYTRPSSPRCESGDYSRAHDYSDIQTFTGQLPQCRRGYDMDLAFRPDGSSIVMTICVEATCHGARSIDGGPGPGAPPGRTAIYESQDGGVTWEQLADFDVPWIARKILPAEDGDTRLWLKPGWAFFQDADGLYTEWVSSTFWSSSGGVEEPPDPPPAPDGHRWTNSTALLDDGRIAWRFYIPPDPFSHPLYLTQDGEDVTDQVLEQLEQEEGCWPRCLTLADGRVLLTADYDAEELIGPDGAAEGRPEWQDTGLPWPTIRDPDTGGQWPILMPYEVLRGGYTLRLLAMQQGPFLRVVDVGDRCLPVKAKASPDVENLDCAAERVLLTDLAEASEVDDTTWHRVRTPAGIEGWASSRYLE